MTASISLLQSALRYFFLLVISFDYKYVLIDAKFYQTQNTRIHPEGAGFKCACAVGASINKSQDYLKFAN